MYYRCADVGAERVAPFTGAWIEIFRGFGTGLPVVVAPFTGAWIEIPVRCAGRPHDRVAPFTGAWIEMGSWLSYQSSRMCRSLHGSVD